METLKFKVGDKVRVKSLEWYKGNKDANGLVYIDEQGVVFDKTMANLCGEIVQIEEVNKTGYFINGNAGFFEDWMLEDEVVAPDAPDALKKWTISEARKYLAGKKLFCTNYQESENLQRKLLECGCYWSDILETIDIERWAIYISHSSSGQMYHDNKNVFEWSLDNREVIKVEDVLKIEIKEEKPKFDFCTLEPFDKVIVKNNGCAWRCNFFSHKEENRFYCVVSTWDECLPYNDETKHLVGTLQDAPEFYRI